MVYDDEVSVSTGTIQASPSLSGIPDNGIVYISEAPEMPQLKAQLIAPGSGAVAWKMTITFKRPNRNDEDVFTKSLPLNQPWDLKAEWGQNFYGGKVWVEATYQGKTYKKQFNIRGTNPSEATIKNYIGNAPFYAVAIARQESGVQLGRSYLQFNEVGTLGPDYSQDLKYTPNRENGAGGEGWGIFQCTNPAPPRNAVWSWKVNVDYSKTVMATKYADAAAWIAKQKQQQAQEDPSNPLSLHTFTWSGVSFKEGTAKTPTDACAIEAFNGVTPTWAVYWKNATKQWIQADNSNNYVAAVCRFI